MEDSSTRQRRRRPEISIVPESSVLQQLQHFLPKLQTANAELVQHPLSESAVSIIDVHEESSSASSGSDSEEDTLPANTSEHVQMDIACGILDLHDQAAISAAEAALLTGAQHQNCTNGDSDDDSTSSDDSAISERLGNIPESADNAFQQTKSSVDGHGEQTHQSQIATNRKHYVVKKQKPTILEL